MHKANCMCTVSIAIILSPFNPSSQPTPLWNRNSVTRLGAFLKPVAKIILPKSPTLLDNFCKGVEIFHFYSEIIFGQLL